MSSFEDFLYEIYYSGLYEEVMEYVGKLREKDPYSDFETIVERAYSEIKKLKELKENGGIA
jgi:hypothetical protein